MNKKIIAIIGAVSLLSACETASQKVVSSTSQLQVVLVVLQLQAQLKKRKVCLLKLNKLLLKN